MKIKRVVKRICALGTGVTMLGATAMGAMAADLSEYPSMFVKDGTFNGLIVVGEAADTVDSIAAIDIASNMKVRAGATTTTAVSGDAWLVGTSSKKYELANSIGTGQNIGEETIRNITTYISDVELSALADGKWATNEADYAYNQYLYFDNTPASVKPISNRVVKYAEDDDDMTADNFFIANSGQIGRFRLEFTSNAQSDVTDSAGAADTTGTYLDDFEDTKITMLGKEYTVVQARRLSAGGDLNQNGIKLVLMSGANSDTLLEGESKSYSVGDKVYDLTLAFVDDDECKFTINGEATNKLKDGDTYVLSDKSEVGVSEMLYQDYAGGVHSCTFFLGARKMELRDDTVTDGVNSHQLRVGSEDIDGADVIIEATDSNTTFTVSVISVNMTADDDYFVGAGKKLSDVIAAAGDEKEVLMDGAIDFEYKGLEDSPTHDLRLKTSSSRRYKLTAYDGDGDAVDIPLAYANVATTGLASNVTLGEEAYSGTRTNQKRLILKEGEEIEKDDVFILTSSSTISPGASNVDGSGKSYLLQYSGSDRQTKTAPKIRFKNLGSGETLEYSVPTSAGNASLASIKVGGFSFDVLGAFTQTVDDFRIIVDLNGNGFATDGLTGAFRHSSVTFIDYYGSEIGFSWNTTTHHNDTQGGNSSTPLVSGGTSTGTFIGVNITTPDGNDYDNIVPSVIAFNITGTTDPELRASTPAGLSLLTPDGETEVSYGYTSMGAFLKFQEPSGDPDELTLTYPEKQRLPQVYVTSGATTSKKSASGDLTKVEVGVASKLDSEVTSVTAQNLIVVGGPCVNTVAAELLGNPADCAAGFTPGKARVKLFEHSNGNMAMLVAGYSGADTRLAGSVIANRWEELSGTEVEVEGTTYSDATISAPTVVETAE